MASIAFAHADIEVDGQTILEDVVLDVADGEFVGVIGPSGSGKTTLLRAVAGFATVTRGQVLFDGLDVADVSPSKRDVGMVFQELVLFSHRSVGRNVSFPLEIRRQHAAEIRRRVDAEARALHLEHLLERHPNTLSPGEAQLVQIARSLVRTPRVLLLDEPLARLDEATRRRMRVELRMLQEGYGVTTLMATNDPEDALHMPSRLAVLHGGRVVQVAAPDVVRTHPATLDAAMATGDCTAIPVVVERGGDGFWLTCHDPAGGPALRHRAWSPALADWTGGQVLMIVRPGDVVVSDTGPVRARIERVVPGARTTLICDIAGQAVAVHAPGEFASGDHVDLRIDHVTVFDPAFGRAIT